ncbi:CBO0543 family protein [Bacillus sp. JJ1562]|uniref:CBO0543 family protein n=1 Tax=Bacillus sp. JJ1562 TaxID=3122960 RepID=UPI003002E7A1
MNTSHLEQFEKAVKLREESTQTFIDAWKEYFVFYSFEFWLIVAIFLVPLIILYFKIDRSNILLIGFFGYSINFIGSMINLFGVNRAFWNYPIPMIPAAPSIAYDTSLVPVTFMFIYQWSLNKNKNYFILALLASIIFSFLVEPLFIRMNLFKLYPGITHVHRFFCFIGISIIAWVITTIFLKMKETEKVKQRS